MHPSVAVHTLNDQLLVPVVAVTEVARHFAVARSAHGVLALPAASHTRGRAPAVKTSHTPLALPAAFGNVAQRWDQAVRVIGDVTLVAQQQATLIIRATTSLTHSAVQAAPAFLQDHLGDLDRDTKRVIALAALSTNYHPGLLAFSNAAARFAHVLIHEKLVLGIKQDKCGWMVIVIILVLLITVQTSHRYVRHADGSNW